MTIDKIAPEALNLPLHDRVQLAASLWDSIEDPYALSVERNDEDAIVLALSRDAEIESGKATPISHSDLMARLRQ
jgi:putative addiction module component (TIGR02574 family)